MRIAALIHFLTLGLLVSPDCAGQPVSVELLSVSADGNSRIEFNHLSTEPIAGESNPVQGIVNVSTSSDRRFSVFYISVEREPGRRHYVYRFRLRQDDVTPRLWFESVFSSSSTGRFPDQEVEVPYKILAFGKTSEGKVRIIIHPLDPVPVCRQVDPDPRGDAIPVYVTRRKEIIVRIECTTTSVFPRILQIEDPYTTNKGYWTKVNLRSQYWGQQSPKPITSGSFDLLFVELDPQPLRAILSRATRSWGKQKFDDEVRVDYTYAMLPAGIAQQGSVRVPIVFDPPFEVLLAFLLLGVLAGTMFWLITESRSVKEQGWARVRPVLGRALLAALILMVFSLVAYSAGCRLELFTFQVNPFDVLMQFLMGIAACLYTTNREVLRRKLRSLTEKLALVFLVLGALAPSDLKAQGLTGLAACPGGWVYGLDNNGGVYRFESIDPDSRTLIAKIRQFQYTGMNCAEVNGRPFIFISALSAGAGPLIRLNIESGSWRDTAGIEVFVGLDYEPRKGLLFLSAPQKKMIATIRPDFKGGPDPWQSVYGDVYSIGPLVVDGPRNRILIADAFSGVIRAIDIDSRKQREVIRGFGEISGLALNPSKTLCYVADRGRKTIFSFSLETDPSKPGTFAQHKGLASLTGFTVDSQGNVWFARKFSREVIVFDSQGRRLNQPNQ